MQEATAIDECWTAAARGAYGGLESGAALLSTTSTVMPASGDTSRDGTGTVDTVSHPLQLPLAQGPDRVARGSAVDRARSGATRRTGLPTSIPEEDMLAGSSDLRFEQPRALLSLVLPALHLLHHNCIYGDSQACPMKTVFTGLHGV